MEPLEVCQASIHQILCSKVIYHSCIIIHAYRVSQKKRPLSKILNHSLLEVQISGFKNIFFDILKGEKK